MRISGLADRSGVPLATIKYYLRAGLLAPGTPVNARQSRYTDAHLGRLRLIRGLISVLGSSLAQVRRLLAVIDDPAHSPLEAMGLATAALPLGGVVPAGAAGTAGAAAATAAMGSGGGVPDQAQDPDPHPGSGPAPGAVPAAGAVPAPTPRRAIVVLGLLGYRCDPRSPTVWQLDAALTLAERVGVTVDPAQLAVYGAAARRIAAADFARVPWDDPAAAAEFAVLGTALYEPVLLALRRLAHTELGHARDGGAPRTPGSTDRREPNAHRHHLP